MKNFQVKHGQFNSIILLKTFSFEGSKTFALMTVGFFTFDMSWNLSTTFFFYWGFLSQPFTNHRTASEGGGHFFNSSLSLPPASQIFRH